MRLKNLLIVGGLATWYIFTSPSSQKLANKKEYPLPEEIKTVETTLHYNKKKISVQSSLISREERQEKIIRTDDIDFSKDFYIKTDRYEFIRDKDWLPSRLIGHTLSISGKLIFWDWDYGWGQDEHRARAALSMLENNKDIKDLTLRLNHNEAIYDMVRMFSDDKLINRNNFLARVLIGIPSSLGDELWAEFSRGSYYNPITRTAVCYSNIESITAHEIGHHKDFSRFDSDWEYMMFRTLPPVMLYQEWKASTIARDKILSDDDKYQFNRYLVPAFLTYCMLSYRIIKRWVKGKEKEE